MKGLLRFLSLAFVVMLGGCTAMMESSSYGSSDLYITNNRIRVAEELTARAEAEKAEAEARKAMWEARKAEAEYYATTGENYTSIVANDYESAYARRLYGFNSPTYRLPASYYNLSTNEAMRYASAYDPAFYNIMVSGDQVWVEPKYVTSMFGTWGATNVTFGIYASPWVYGWGVYASPFHYTMWGYPHYSWYDWNWNMCYNPYHWYYPGYYPHHHSHHHYPHYHPGHPPQHRPNYGHSGNRFNTDERRHSSSRYTSPTSNQNYGKNLNGGRVGTTIRNSGTTSSGMNHSRISAGSSSSSSRYNTTSGRSTTESRSGSNSNFRSSSSSNRSSVSSSSSNSSRSNSSSNFRSSSSSSSRSSSSSSSSSNFRSSGGSSSSGRTSSRR